jgi:hypothetical protein
VTLGDVRDFGEFSRSGWADANIVAERSVSLLPVVIGERARRKQGCQPRTEERGAEGQEGFLHHMKASELLAKIESSGGRLALIAGDQLECNDVPEELLAELREQKYLVMALLKERRACEAYEASGRNPGWYREYPHSTTIWPKVEGRYLQPGDAMVKCARHVVTDDEVRFGSWKKSGDPGQKLRGEKKCKLSEPGQAGRCAESARGMAGQRSMYVKSVRSRLSRG